MTFNGPLLPQGGKGIEGTYHGIVGLSLDCEEAITHAVCPSFYPTT